MADVLYVIDITPKPFISPATLSIADILFRHFIISPRLRHFAAMPRCLRLHLLAAAIGFTDDTP